MERFQDRAIVLSAIDYGDADKVVQLLTRDRGRVSAFAAGARKSRRRFQGKLEPCTLLAVHLAERSSAMLRLDGAEVIESFHQLRANLPTLARALYALELSRELAREQAPQSELFECLATHLESLCASAGAPQTLRFELSALRHVGLMPSVARCSICGRAPGSHPRFDPSHGGVVCDNCAFRAPRAAQVSPAVLQALTTAQDGSVEVSSPQVLRTARETLSGFISYHLRRELKSRAFLESVEA